MSFEDDVKKVIDEYLPGVLEKVVEQVTEKLPDLLKRQGGGVVTRLPALAAPVVSISPGTVDPVALALSEAWKGKWVLILYRSHDDIPKLSNDDLKQYADEITSVTRASGQQSISMKSGAKIVFAHLAHTGGRGVSVDLVLHVLGHRESLTSLGLA